LRHGGSNPVWLYDIGVLLETLPPDFDWTYCLKGAPRHAGWMIFVIRFANEVLGAAMPPYIRRCISSQTPGWMVKAVLERWGNLTTYRREPPMPLRRLMKRNLRALPRALTIRWPNPLESIWELSWPIRFYSAIPAQTVVYTRRAITWPSRQLALR
jgi:hypothetical protein